LLPDTPSSHRRAYLLFLFIEGTTAIFGALYGTVVAVYRVETAGLNPLQLVLVGTALELSAFVFSIPTGVLADTYSRRLAVIAGTILMGAGFTLEGAVPRFGVILLAQAIWGAGVTCISGAQEAWITDEIGTERATHVFVRASQVGTVGGLVGIAGSVALASVRLNLPLLTGGLLTVALGIALIFIMPETGFHPAAHTQRASWRSMAATLQQSSRIVGAAPVLLTVLVAVVFYGASSEGFDRLWQAHFLTNLRFPPLAHFAPVVWFGVINATAMVLGIGVTELVRRLDTRNHLASVRAFFGINAGLILGLVVFGVSRDFFLAVGAYVAVSLLRQARNPIYMAWLAQRADSSVRATVLSMSDQADALGQIAGGPVIGLVGTLNGLRAALVVAAAFLTPSLLLFARAAGQRDVVTPPAEPLAAAVEPPAPVG
jgi:DHA3 family tetracycline resistance protein-like MFS transporter